MRFFSFEYSMLTLIITSVLILIIQSQITTNNEYRNDVYALDKINSNALILLLRGTGDAITIQLIL